MLYKSNTKIMKTINFLLLGLITALSFSSCTVSEYLDPENRTTSFDVVNQKMVLFFKDTKYAMIENSWVIGISKDSIVGNGRLIKVDYNYGTVKKYYLYYVDNTGKNVRVKEFATKNNGYPSTKTYLYDINNDGEIVVDWINIILLIFAFLFLLFLRGT